MSEITFDNTGASERLLSGNSEETFRQYISDGMILLDFLDGISDRIFVRNVRLNCFVGIFLIKSLFVGNGLNLFIYLIFN